jgi:hypothetical protein
MRGLTLRRLCSIAEVPTSPVALQGSRFRALLTRVFTADAIVKREWSVNQEGESCSDALRVWT